MHLTPACLSVVTVFELTTERMQADRESTSLSHLTLTTWDKSLFSVPKNE